MRTFRQPRWLALLCYLFVALYLTAPIHKELSERFLGGAAGDAYEMARHVWWFKTALQSGADIFQHALFAYPTGFPALQLWSNPLQFFPMWLFAFVLPLAAAYNSGILLSLTLNGWAMYLLARRRLATAQPFPAFIAGLVYMAFPLMQGHLFEGHAGLLAQWPLPLFIICLFDYVDYGGKRRFLGAVLFFLLAAMGHTLQVIYALAPLTALFFLARLYHRDYLGAARLVNVTLLGSLLLLLFLSPIWTETLNQPGLTVVGGYSRYSIDLLGLISPSFANPFWADIAAHSTQVLGQNIGEGASYIGIIGGFLALLGIVNWRAGRWWLLVAAVAWLLALGPVLKAYDQVLTATIAGYDAVMPLPYAFFIDLPLFELARAPGRFMFLFVAMFAMLAGAGAAALGASRLLRRRHRYLQVALALLLCLLLLEDYRLFAAFPSVPVEIPAEIAELGSRGDIRAVYNVPYDHLPTAKEAMYLQTAHGKPLIAGQDTRVSPVDPARLALLAQFDHALLIEAGADAVIVHKTGAVQQGQASLLRRAALALGEPEYEDERFALFKTPFTRAQTPLRVASKMEGQSHVSYIYKGQPGWLEFSATLEAVNRRVNLSLNDVLLEKLTLKRKIPLTLPLPIAERGYHSLRIALDPPCPERIDTSLLQCQDVTIEDVNIRGLSDGAIYDPIRIEDGIVLAGYFLPEEFTDEVDIRFWWRFEAARSRNDRRFVHVLDARGLPVSALQVDQSLGEISAGNDRTETVRLDLRGLAAGEYQVLTGWYALPDAVRYDVLTNVAGAQNDTVVLGTIRVRG